MKRELGLALSLGLGSGLCDCSALSKSCNEMGCVDSVSIALRSADGVWPDGSYSLTIMGDAEEYTCTMELPDDRPSETSVVSLECQPDMGYMAPTLSPQANCVETRSEDSVRESCVPIAGQYELEAALLATPASVSVRLARDGKTLIDESHSPGYSTFYPNGRECEPACEQAQLAIDIP